jgi:O-antigen/teichoic acid export membrane protein
MSSAAPGEFTAESVAVDDSAPSRQDLLRNSSLVLGVQILVLGCTIFNNVFISLLLGPQGKGMIYALQLISGLGLTILCGGLGTAAVFHLGKAEPAQQGPTISATVWGSLLLSLVAVAMVAALSPSLLPLVQAKVPAVYFWIAVAATPPMVLAFNLNYVFLFRRNMTVYNVVSAAPSVLLAGGVAAALVASVASTSILAIAWFASVTASAVPMVYAFRREVFRFPKAQEMLRAFSYGMRSHLGFVVQYLQHRAPVLLVAFFCPVSELGIYSVAVAIAEVLWYIPHAISTVLMPHIAAHSIEESSRTTPLFCRVTLFVIAVLAMLAALIAEWLVPAVLPRFSEAVPVLWWLLPGIVIASVFKVLSSDFYGRGEPLHVFYPAISALLFESVLCIWVIPRWGIRAAAAATSVAYLINALLHVAAYRRMSRVSATELLLIRPRDLRILSRVFLRRRVALSPSCPN